MQTTLEGMTQEKWNALPFNERERLRDYAGLSPQLRPYLGARVEVVTMYDEVRRFIVGISTGWRPCHLEISRRNAHGGIAAEREYKSVRFLYQVR